MRAHIYKLKQTVDTNYFNIGFPPSYTDIQIRKLEKGDKLLKVDTRKIETPTGNGGSKLPRSPIMCIYITFGEKMSNFLNLDVMGNVMVGFCGFPHKLPTIYDTKIFPDFKKVPIETLMVYSDLVATAIRTGNVLSNILDILSYTVSGNVLNRSNALHIFRPLRHNRFVKTSVEIRTRDGDIVSFPKGSYSVLEIFVRLRPAAAL